MQVRPQIEMQVESNEQGERWLTCVVLPQQGPEIPYEEGLCCCWSLPTCMYMYFWPFLHQIGGKRKFHPL